MMGVISVGTGAAVLGLELSGKINIGQRLAQYMKKRIGRVLG